MDFRGANAYLVTSESSFQLPSPKITLAIVTILRRINLKATHIASNTYYLYVSELLFGKVYVALNKLDFEAFTTVTQYLLLIQIACREAVYYNSSFTLQLNKLIPTYYGYTYLLPGGCDLNIISIKFRSNHSISLFNVSICLSLWITKHLLLRDTRTREVMPKNGKFSSPLGILIGFIKKKHQVYIV